MTALSRTGRGLLAFVLVFAMLTSLGGSLPAAAAPDSAPNRAPLVNDLRLSQLYGGGGNTGATYTHDFMELFNAGANTINLSGYSVQYAAATGASWQVTNLSGSIGPGQYFLIQQAQGTGGTTPLPTPNVVGSIAMGGTGGKAALVNTTTALAVACPTGAQIIDFVGFAATANCFEGSGPAPAPSNTTATIRNGAGCVDTDNNAADFSTGAPTPRNTASPTNSCGVDVPPIVTGTNPANLATNVPVDVTVDVTFSEPVTIAGTVAINCTSSGLQNVTPTGGPTTFSLPHTDFALGETCTVTILASQVTDQGGASNNMAAPYVWSFQVSSGCFAASTAIHAIQGSGLASPLVGQQHVVEAKVIADYQGVGSINGYFIQEPLAQQDADPATSEGLFVYDPALLVNVAVGDYVRVAGTVAEFQNQTQLTTLTAVTICPFQATATPVNVTLPFPNTAYPERFEGMSVVMTQTLTVNETYNLGRGGILTFANGRLEQPTDVVLPGAPAIALQAANNLNQITLDDGSLVQNPDPIIYPTAPPPAPSGLTALNTVRSGDSVSAIAGVFTQGNPGWTTPGNIYRVHPFAMPTFTPTNPRPSGPLQVPIGGSLKVSSSNVLNYFLTLDTTNTAPFPCGPNQNMECRGANTADEFTRQRAKLLQALYILNADIVGLMELENTPNVEPLADLVNGLNALAGPGTYDYINAGTINPGDVIKVGLIYKPGTVQPVGNFAILNSLVDPNFDTSLHRPALAQTFQEIATNGRFTVIVNHLKSKGCGSATGANADLGDGQSCWNLARTTAANALVNWALSDPTGTGDPDFMIVGDLNSYAMEDPMVALETAGYTNLETYYVGANAYSYVFSAQAGSLDHSMANASLFGQVSGATTWHINADEPTVLDYNTEFKSGGQIGSLFNPDAFRTSDHDPLLIGLNLTPAAASIVLTKTVGTDPLACAATDDITVPAGTNVTYCYSVENTGNLTLHRHDLADSKLGALLNNFPYALAPGASVFLTATTPITITTVNTATWTAYNAGPIDVVTASDAATVTVVIVPNPAINLVKTVGTTPATCAVTDNISVAAGTTVYYCYVAENTGNVNLNFHTLVDSELGALASNLPYVLAPGAFSPEVIVPETINIDTTNVATWTATTMNFIDISATGTALNLTDDSEANITSPFPFTFFGATSSDLRVGNNGGILFGVTTGDLGLTNAALPATSGLPAPAILPFWDDFDDETGNVFWQVQGTAPNRKLIVQWHNRPHYNGIGAVTFEVILYETSNAIEFLYLDTDFGNALYNHGLSATSGLQESTSSAVQYSFNQAVLLNSMTIRFEPTAYTPVVTMAPTASDSDSATVTALFPNIFVAPLSLSSTQATNTTITQTLNVGNTGAAPLTWEIAETAPDAAPRNGIQAASEPVFNVPAAVASKADCAAFENYLGNEPAGWAEFCGQPATAPASSPSNPTSTGYTLNLRAPSRNLYRFTLNNFPGQVSVGAQAANIYALDFDASATTLYALNTSTNELGTLSTTTGAFTAIVACPAPAAGTWTGLSIDPVSNVFYASTAANLYTINPATCSPTLIGPFGVTSGTMIDIAIGSAGVMYGHEIFTDSIYTINTSTGAATLVGPTGFLANFAQGMDFDNEDGTLYIFLYVGTGVNHYGTVNLATGAVTPLASSNPLGEFEGATQTLGTCIPNDYGWLSLTPITGTTAAAGTTPVDVTFDSAGLPVGTYTGQLCIRSNDPDNGPGNETNLVVVPVTLTVPPPTAVTLSDLAASSEQAQAPLPVSGLPLAALPAVVSLALGAAYVLRRKE